MEGASRTKPIQTTKWGTACSQCASAKAKCSRKPTDTPGTKCDRCERLLKQCTDQVHRPRKPRQPKQQQKLEDATDFDSLNASPVVASSEGSVATSPSMSPHTASPQPWQLNSSPLPYNNSPGGPSHNPRLLSVPGLYPLYTGQARDSDEHLLETFRNELMPRFPFVLLHPEATADTLKVNRPFLTSAIRLVASLRNPQSMRGQIGHIMSYIADHVVVRGERTMDLLFGILVVTAWYHYYQMQNCQLNSLLCLTESVIADLGLGQDLTPGNGIEAQFSREEKRALLGAWYLRACVAIQFNQLKSTPFTPYMQRCLTEISQDPEYESDELMVLLVRIQRLANTIASGAPEHILAGTWKALENIMQNAPQRWSNHPLLTIALNSTALRLQKSGSGRYNQTAESVKNWLRSWLSTLSAPTSTPIPTSATCHLIYTISVLEATTCTPREVDMWDSQFWDALEERTLLQRSLVIEWANVSESGDGRENTAKRPSQDASAPLIHPRPAHSGRTSVSSQVGGSQYTNLEINCLPNTTTPAPTIRGQQGQAPLAPQDFNQEDCQLQTPTNAYNPHLNEQVEWISHPSMMAGWNTGFWQDASIPTTTTGVGNMVAGQEIDMAGGPEHADTGIDPQLWFGTTNVGPPSHQQHGQPHHFGNDFHHRQ